MPITPSKSDQEASIRELTSRVFDDPTRITEVLSHRLTRRLEIAPHQHRQQLQLDLIVDASGTADIDGQHVHLSRTTLLAVYPGQQHGYVLEPTGGSPAEVYHVKLNVWTAWQAIDQRVWSEVATGLPRQAGLESAMRAVVRLGSVQKNPSLLLLSKVAESLALWPRRGTLPTGESFGRHYEGYELSADAVMAQAMLADSEGRERVELPGVLSLIESRLVNPPSLDEMAAVSHLSPRHFTRRFKAVLGCTPHAYVTARRLHWARQLLLEREGSLQQVSQELGFSTLAGFSRWFTQNAGTTPSAFRDNDRLL